MKKRTNQRCEEEKNVLSAPSSTPQVWKTVDGAPPLLDEVSNASCQALFKGIESEEWEKLYHKYVELNRAVNLKKPGNNHKAKAL